MFLSYLCHEKVWGLTSLIGFGYICPQKKSPNTKLVNNISSQQTHIMTPMLPHIKSFGKVLALFILVLWAGQGFSKPMVFQKSGNQISTSTPTKWSTSHQKSNTLDAVWILDAEDGKDSFETAGWNFLPVFGHICKSEFELSAQVSTFEKSNPYPVPFHGRMQNTLYLLFHNLKICNFG